MPFTSASTVSAAHLPAGVLIEPERPGDGPAIEALLDEAFGADRHKKQSYRFRQHVGPIEALSLVARDGERRLYRVLKACRRAPWLRLS